MILKCGVGHEWNTKEYPEKEPGQRCNIPLPWDVMLKSGWAYCPGILSVKEDDQNNS